MRLRLSLLLGATLLVLGTVAAACDGDELTLEEYFRQFVALQKDAGERMEKLEDPTEEEFGSETEQVEAFRAFFSAGVASLRDFADALNDIDPPEEVEDLHNEAVAVLTDGVEIIEGIVDELADIESTSGLAEVMERAGPELNDVDERGTEGCFGLQAVADANGIDVDLECEDQE